MKRILNDDGVTSIEYGILAAFISICLIASLFLVSKDMKQDYCVITSNLESSFVNNSEMSPENFNTCVSMDIAVSNPFFSGFVGVLTDFNNKIDEIKDIRGVFACKGGNCSEETTLSDMQQKADEGYDIGLPIVEFENAYTESGSGFIGIITGASGQQYKMEWKNGTSDTHFDIKGISDGQIY